MGHPLRECLMELAYISVDASSLQGSRMRAVRAPSGHHDLRGNLKSGCDYLAIAGVSNFAKKGFSG